MQYQWSEVLRTNLLVTKTRKLFDWCFLWASMHKQKRNTAPPHSASKLPPGGFPSSLVCKGRSWLVLVKAETNFPRYYIISQHQATGLVAIVCSVVLLEESVIITLLLNPCLSFWSGQLYSNVPPTKTLQSAIRHKHTSSTRNVLAATIGHHISFTILIYRARRLRVEERVTT